MVFLSLTSAQEDYLEVILLLADSEETVRISDIAKRLDIAKSSANQAVKTLKNLKLVVQNRYGPIRLTKRGLEEAKKVRYRHVILRSFLTEVLNVDSVIAEEDACRIEHAVSTQTMIKLVNFLDDRNCIDKSMDVEEVKLVLSTNALNTLSPGTKGKVKRIDAEGSLRRRILEMGIVTGDIILIKGAAPMGDPIEITVKDYNLSLRKNEAASILVEVI
jgi:DtxR family Mn-dependent transcriptional regulator